MKRRRRARQLALQILYQAEVGRFAVEEVLARVRGERPREDWPFIATLAAGVADRRRALDRSIAPHLKGWALDRLAAVDRIILRLAVYELQTASTPVGVAINEAVELAKRYGGDASARFVHGILGAVARTPVSGSATDGPSGRRRREGSRA